MPADNDRQTIGRGRFLRLVSENGWEYAERTGATGVVAVLAVTPENELVLTEQYRPPVRQSVIDLPAGLAGDVHGAEDEAMSMAARRELEEETGFTAGSLRRIAPLPSSPGLSSEVVELFLAEDLSRISSGGGDESESIEVHLVSRATIADWLDERVTRGCLVDPKVYAALWWLEQLR